MKKWSVILVALVLLTGCTSSPKIRDVNEVMDQLEERVFYDSSSVLIEPTELDSFYFFEEGVLKEGMLRMAEDTTANQVAVFKVNDMISAKKTIEITLDRMTNEMARYFPYEAEKVADACIMNELDLFVVVIAPDSDCICAEGLSSLE